MNGYKIIQNVEEKVGRTKDQQLTIKRSDNKKIHLADVKELTKFIIDSVNKKHNTECKVLVIGRNILGDCFKIKGYEEDPDYMFEDDNEYFNGRVAESTKFENFFQISYYITYKEGNPDFL